MQEPSATDSLAPLLDSRERDWLSATLWNDIREIGILCLHQWVKGYHCLCLGYKAGSFCDYMQGFGWIADGAHTSEWVAPAGRKYDLIALMGILEDVPTPLATIMSLKALLAPGGVMVIHTPNTFSELQGIAKLRPPGLTNYFNFANLSELLEEFGLRVVYRTSTFPMEWFILWGDNYSENPELYQSCHEKRMAFELALPTEVRRAFYAKLAGMGWGSNCIVFAVEQHVLEPQPHIPFDWLKRESEV